jgi:NitT/TauT family transport system substrate-binding protein
VDVVYVADLANLVSNGLITNEESVRSRSELVQGMVRATLRGLAYTIDNPDEAFDITLRHVPEAASDPGTEAVNRAVLAESIEFWRAGPNGLGRSDEAAWQDSLATMVRMGLVPPELDVGSSYSNEFISEVGE